MNYFDTKMQKTLEQQISELEADFIAAYSLPDFEQRENEHERILCLLRPLWHDQKMQKAIEYKNIPEKGCRVFPIKQFRKFCMERLFIDYDGSGVYATKKQMSNISVCPSEITNGYEVKRGFTHVVWFNR